MYAHTHRPRPGRRGTPAERESTCANVQTKWATPCTSVLQNPCRAPTYSTSDASTAARNVRTCRAVRPLRCTVCCRRPLMQPRTRSRPAAPPQCWCPLSNNYNVNGMCNSLPITGDVPVAQTHGRCCTLFLKLVVVGSSDTYSSRKNLSERSRRVLWRRCLHRVVVTQLQCQCAAAAPRTGAPCARRTSWPCHSSPPPRIAPSRADWAIA